MKHWNDVHSESLRHTPPKGTPFVPDPHTLTFSPVLADLSSMHARSAPSTAQSTSAPHVFMHVGTPFNFTHRAPSGHGQSARHHLTAQ